MILSRNYLVCIENNNEYPNHRGLSNKVLRVWGFVQNTITLQFLNETYKLLLIKRVIPNNMTLFYSIDKPFRVNAGISVEREAEIITGNWASTCHQNHLLFGFYRSYLDIIFLVL